MKTLSILTEQQKKRDEAHLSQEQVGIDAMHMEARNAWDRLELKGWDTYLNLRATGKT